VHGLHVASWRSNVEAVVFCIVEAVRAMVAAGRPGSIVCTASINGWFPEETPPAELVRALFRWYGEGRT
jgi:NAD(P)-dependent dehydrogenase (short-subunit alcohol dehydrogenase family)